MNRRHLNRQSLDLVTPTVNTINASLHQHTDNRELHAVVHIITVQLQHSSSQQRTVKKSILFQRGNLLVSRQNVPSAAVVCCRHRPDGLGTTQRKAAHRSGATIIASSFNNKVDICTLKMTSDNRHESSYDLATCDVKLPFQKHPYSCGLSGVYDRRMFDISERDKPIPGPPSTQDWIGGLRCQRRHTDGTLTGNLFNPAPVISQTSHDTSTNPTLMLDL